MSLRPLVIVVSLILLVSGRQPSAQQRFQIFFLAVGSSHYLNPSSPELHGFGELSGANSSARLVRDILSRGGAITGITLVSDRMQFIGKADFDTALEDVAQQMIVRRPKNRLLVVYFAGHGISEGVALNHFSVPGNFVYGRPLDRLRTDELADHAIHALRLVYKLDALKVPYLLLLDTCYEGPLQSLLSPFLTDANILAVQGVAWFLRYENEFHRPNPVLFSAQPGMEVPLAPDPRNPKQASLGPIARRLLLLSEKVVATGKPLLLSHLVAQLTSAALDRETQPPVTHAAELLQNAIVLSPKSESGLPIEPPRMGTATTPDFCCGSDMSDR